MKLSEQLKQDHECGDFGRALEGYAERAEELESLSEQRYSQASDLASIRAAKAVLREIVPDCGHDSIPKAEWQNVMQTLMKWETSLTEQIDN